MAYDFAVNCTRNASPYYDLTIYDPGKEIDSGILAGSLIPTIGGIDTKILRKLDSIEFHDLHGPLTPAVLRSSRLQHRGSIVNTCILVFKGLTLDEAEYPVFKMTAGLNLHLGWYDWWSFKKVSDDNVFNGIVKYVEWGYEAAGVTCTLTLYELQNIIFFQAEIKPIFDGTETDLVQALKKLCKYCNSKLTFNVTNQKVLSYVTSSKCGEDKPWAEVPKFVVDPISRKNRPRTPEDIVKHLSERFGQAANVRMGYLYFGSHEAFNKSTPPDKVFDYRSSQRSFGEQIYHTGEDIFEKVEINDYPTQSSNAAGVVTIDRDTKAVTNKKGTADVLIAPKKFNKIRVVDFGELTSFTEASQTVGAQDIAKTYMQKGINVATYSQDLLESKASKTSPFSASNNSKSSELQKASISGQAERMKAKAMTIIIRGALGDPLFSAGRPFRFNGIRSVHMGIYVANEVIHLWKQGEVYKMDVIGSKNDGGDGTYLGPNVSDQQAKAAAQASDTKKSQRWYDQLRYYDRGPIVREHYAPKQR